MPPQRPKRDIKKERQWMFKLFVGGFALIGLLIMIAGPFTVANDNWSFIGIAIVAIEAIILIAGFIWFVRLVRARPK